jgi:hypothetical protein
MGLEPIPNEELLGKKLEEHLLGAPPKYDSSWMPHEPIPNEEALGELLVRELSVDTPDDKRARAAKALGRALAAKR